MGDGFTNTWTLEMPGSPLRGEWDRTRTGELRSTYMQPNGEWRMSSLPTTGITISAGLSSTPTRGLYRIHLVYGDLLDEVVEDGIFADYRIVAKDLQDAREKAIFKMGQESLDLEDYAIVVELIGFF